MAVGIVAVFWCGWVLVSPRNFGGYDEWLIVDLGSRGIVGVPYANRPLVLLWAVPPACLLAPDLRWYHLFEGAYLCTAGLLCLGLGLRLLPRWTLLAFVAAVFSACWAPLDKVRLDVVLMTSYAGNTAATLGSLLLYVEAIRRRSWPWLVAAMLLGLVTARAGEVVIPLLAVAPVLARAAPRPQPRAFVLLWLGMVAVAGALAAAPLLAQAPQGSYQLGALGLQAGPLGVLVRLGMLLRFELGPVLLVSPRELAHPAVALAAVSFLLVAVWLVRERGMDLPPARDLYALMASGVLLAIVALGPYAASGGALTPSRTQVLAAPGIGLLLAAALSRVAVAFPRRLAAACLVASATWVVAVATGRVQTMQEEWNGQSFWPAQNDTLVRLTRLVPDVKPGTFLLLVDEGRVWPATFTFRHAIRYLYGDQAGGAVWGALPFLYPTSFGPAGVRSEPWPVIRRAWRVDGRLHAYDEVIVARRSASGSVSVENRWPPELPPLPAGAVYDPWARVAPGSAAPAERRILVPSPKRD
jgi:hypothetical protein